MAPAEVKPLESAKPFILSEGLAPIPPSVVKKIQNLEFVDFAELMPDNRDLLRRIDLTDNKASTKAPLRRVTTITSWAQCFMAYSAILLSKFPDKLVEVMAYGKMIIKEAGRHSGEGWKVYKNVIPPDVSS